MPWEKSFDRDTVLQQSMALFWRKGFKRLSMADIVAATGASRYGLYDEFGDKRDLYLSCLDWYTDYLITGLLGELGSEAAGLEALRAYRDRILAGLDIGDNASMGCFMCAAAAEQSAEPAVRERARAHFARVEAALATAFENARDAGEIDDRIDPADAAIGLTASVQGLSLFARAGMPVETMRAQIRAVFRAHAID